MKIWLLTSEFPPDFGGGIATYCRQYADSLASEGHAVTVFARATATHAPLMEERDGYRVIRVPVDTTAELAQVSDHWHHFSYCLAETVLQQLASETSLPDQIEFQDYGGIGYYLTKRKLLGEPLLTRIQLAMFCHTPVFELAEINQDPTYRFPEYWLGRMEKFCLLGADAIFAPSHFLAERLQPLTSKPITVLHLPYKLGDLPTPPAKTTDLLFVGRAEYRKGLLQFLEGMEILWRAGHQIRLRAIGGDTTWGVRGISMKSVIRSKYRTFIDEGLLRLDDPMDPEKVQTEVQAARAVVVPSLYENFPYVCIEALAAEIPVIGSRSGGHAELIGDDGSCGLLFDIGDAKSVAHAVLAIADKSPGELAAMGRAGRQRVAEMCDPKTFVANRVAMAAVAVPVPTTYPFANDREDFASKPPPPAAGPVRKGMLSVVIPYFNMGDFVEETLQSVLSSTYRNIEVVIVNDGSTSPGSLEVLEKIRARQHPVPVRVLDTENRGLALARNAGVAAAVGEFVTFIDADDVVDPTYYSKCIDLLQRYDNVSFVYSWVRYFGESEGIWINFDTDFPYFLCANMLAAFLVARTTAVLSAGANREEMRYGMEDYDAWLRMAAQGYRGVSLPQFLSLYRVRSNSMARQMGSSTVLRMYETLVRGNAEVFRRWGPEVALLLYSNGPGRMWNTPSRTYPPLTYGVISTENPAVRSLASTFSNNEKQAVLDVINDPVVVAIGKFVLRNNLHRPALTVTRGAGRLVRWWRRIRRR